MKKRIPALFCALTLLLSAAPAAYALEGDAARCADTLATLGLLTEDYRLTQTATRAQATVLLVRLAGAQSAAISKASSFRDLPDWAAASIAYAAKQGWVYGVTSTAFRPDQAVTADMWFGMLLRMLGYSDQKDFNSSEAALFARQIGLAAQAYSGELTRAQLFSCAADALSFRYKGTEESILRRLVSKNIVQASAVRALGLEEERLTLRQAADRYASAVFSIDVYKTRMDMLIDDTGEDAEGYGSGFFISPDGLAVTSYHVIRGKPYAKATLATGRSYEIERVVYYDAEQDIAVIRVAKTALDKTAATAFNTLKLAGTDEIRTGDKVYTIGNPLGLGLAVSEGVISATERYVERYAQPCVMVTADISEGSSGGALLNEYGHVIAITSGAYTYGNSMYLAVPVNPVMKADLSVSGWTVAEIADKEFAEVEKEIEEAKKAG